MPKCLRLRHENGEEKIVPNGSSYPKEWTFLKAEDCDHEGKLITTATAGSFKLGNLIEQVIQAFPEKIRPTHCTKCEQRKRALNFISENGVVETIRRIAEINRTKDA